MTDVVIHAENLGKKYIIGHQSQNGRYVALRDVLMHNASRLWNTAKDVVRGKLIIHRDSREDVGKGPRSGDLLCSSVLARMKA